MDECLNGLLSAVKQATPRSPEHTRALNRLLVRLKGLPGLRRSTHQDYEHALNKTWEWVCRNITAFDPDREGLRGKTLEEKLMNWINGTLDNRIKDLDSLQFPDGSHKYPDRLDKPTPSGQESHLERLSSDDLAQPPSLSDLDNTIEGLIMQEGRQMASRIEAYILQDPDDRLKRCCSKNYPAGNCHYLSQRLLLKQPPDSMTEIANDLGVNYQTLVNHWKRSCRPMLQEIVKELESQ